MFLRPTTSDVDDHTNRPAMLNSDSTPTNPAAAAAATVEVSPSRKKSMIIGAACSRIPMPAVTLQKSTIQSSQNCGVLIALDADTLAVVTSGFSSIGVRVEALGQPSPREAPGSARRRTA